MFPHKWGKELLPVITSETNLTTYRPNDLTSSSDTVFSRFTSHFSHNVLITLFTYYPITLTHAIPPTFPTLFENFYFLDILKL